MCPAAAVDIARRLCVENQVTVAEIWSYHAHRRPDAVHAGPASRPRRRPSPRPRAETGAAKGRGDQPAAKPCRQGEAGGQAGKAPRRQPKTEAGRGEERDPKEEVALPQLRFDRDRRGYETTALVEAAAAAAGRGKRLLYWFRTPPGVRVGRAPIDETAIRLLEQHNPDVQFDWTRILKAPPPDPRRAASATPRSGSARAPRGPSAPAPPRVRGDAGASRRGAGRRGEIDCHRRRRSERLSHGHGLRLRRDHFATDDTDLTDRDHSVADATDFTDRDSSATDATYYRDRDTSVTDHSDHTERDTSAADTDGRRITWTEAFQPWTTGPAARARAAQARLFQPPARVGRRR